MATSEKVQRPVVPHRRGLRQRAHHRLDDRPAAAGGLAQVLHLRTLQKGRDPARHHARRGVLARQRQGTQHPLHVAGRDRAHVHGSEFRQHVGRHGRAPVAQRLRGRAAPPGLRLLRHCPRFRLRERDRPRAARIAAGARHRAVVRRDPARVGETHQFGAAEADVDAPTVYHEPLNPGTGAAVAHPQHEAVAVDVVAGAGVAHLLGGQGVAVELGHGLDFDFRAEAEYVGIGNGVQRVPQKWTASVGIG